MISFTFRIRKETQLHFRCDRLEDQQKFLNKEGHSFQPFWSNRVTSKNSKSTPPSSSLPRARPPSTLPSCVGLSSCTCNTPIAKGKGWKVAQRLRIRTFWLGATCSFENMTCQNDRKWVTYHCKHCCACGVQRTGSLTWPFYNKPLKTYLVLANLESVNETMTMGTALRPGYNQV